MQCILQDCLHLLQIASGDGETLIIDDEVDNNDIYLEGSGADNDGGVDTEGEDDVIEGKQ